MDSSSEPPKLALFSFPIKGKESPPPPPEISTPPVHKAASIPFQWEEAPGKPRPSCTESKPSSTVARSLDLPPRLVVTHDHHNHHDVKVNNNNNNNHDSSPTTVLEGPYVSRSLSYALPSRKGGSFRNPREESNSRVFFGSSRWVSSSATPGTVKKNDKVVWGSFDFFSSVNDISRGSRGGGGYGGGTKVKITSVRKRSGSFRNLSHSSSQLWTSIYEGFKQVVPWKRSSKQGKLR